MEGVSSVTAVQEASSVIERSVSTPQGTRQSTTSEEAAYVKVSGQIAPSGDSSAQVQEKPSTQQGKPKEAGAEQGAQKSSSTSSKKPGGQELTAEERAQIEKLKARDAEVRAHEQAHLAAIGSYKRGGATYTYETGPDGKRYAVGGEVPIDASPGKTPQETIQKARTIQRAALAPANPSSTDRAVAAQAAQMAAQAQAELAREATSKQGEDGKTKAPEQAGNAKPQEEPGKAQATEPNKETNAPQSTPPPAEDTEDIRAREASINNWNNIAPAPQALATPDTGHPTRGKSWADSKYSTYEWNQNSTWDWRASKQSYVA